MPWREGGPGQFHFSSREGLVALTDSEPLLESFLATNSVPQRRLRDKIAMAASKAGGTRSGYLSYADERSTARRWFHDLATSPDALTGRLRWATFSEGSTRFVSAIVRCLDFGRLPPFETVERHFGARVTVGRVTTNGFEITTFRPKPAKR